MTDKALLAMDEEDVTYSAAWFKIETTKKRERNVINRLADTQQGQGEAETDSLAFISPDET